MAFKAFLARALAASLCCGLEFGAAGAALAQDPMQLSLHYNGSLYVKVLDVAIDQTMDGDRFSASAEIRTSGILSLFKHINLKADSEGRLENAVALPRQFTFQNVDGKKNRRVTATWTPSDVETQSQPHYPSMGDPPATREQKLEAADPLTVLTRLTLLPPGQTPCRGVSQFFDGKQRYDLEYTYESAAAADRRERKLGLVEVVRCKLVFHEVAGFRRKPAEQRSQGLRRDVSIGLGRIGADGPWVVSFLRADTLLGVAEIDLVGAKVGAAKAS